MADLTGACVFVVEDEPIVAFDLRLTLEEAGARVIGPAMSLQQAETLSSEEHISMALLDARLGNADALLARWPGSKVITKPTRSDALLSTIASLFRKACPPPPTCDQPVRLVRRPHRALFDTSHEFF